VEVSGTPKVLMNLSRCIFLSCDVFRSTTCPLLTLTLWSPLFATHSCMMLFYIPNSWHVGIPHGCWFSNGVKISNLWCRDETKGLLWAHTQGCAARHAQVSRIASHDTLWSYTDVLSFHELFLSYLSLSCQKIFVPNLDVSFIRIWNLDSWIQPLW
jgi:hypothetical protein